MMHSTKSLRWGILGAGGIAGTFAKCLKEAERGNLVAVGSRTLEKARQFAETHGISKAYGSYEKLLADGEVDAVYLATPHPDHVRTGIAVLEAGKHLLCEKPLALNQAEAMSLVEAAHRNQRLLAEAFMYRTHPQIEKLLELLREGVIGKVGMIEVSFAFRSGYSPDSRLWNVALGGGGILDVGCYPVSFCRLIAGSLAGKKFLNPIQVQGAGRLHRESGVDEWAVANLVFETGLLAQVSAGVGLARDNDARIYGTEGSIRLLHPWALQNQGRGPFKMILLKRGEPAQEIIVESNKSSYAREADAFALAVFQGAADCEFMSTSDSLGNMQVLDQWRREIGLDA